MVENDPQETATSSFDPQKRFVRLNRIRTDGFVEFEFAIGDPGLALELIMPADAYRAFCHANCVAFLPSIDAPEPTSNVAALLHLMSDADWHSVSR